MSAWCSSRLPSCFFHVSSEIYHHCSICNWNKEMGTASKMEKWNDFWPHTEEWETIKCRIFGGVYCLYCLPTILHTHAHTASKVPLCSMTWHEVRNNTLMKLKVPQTLHSTQAASDVVFINLAVHILLWINKHTNVCMCRPFLLKHCIPFTHTYTFC